MILFGDKKYETTAIEILDNAYKVKTETPKTYFEILKAEPQDIVLEDENIIYEFNTADYSDIQITERKGVTTIVFNFVDHVDELKAQIVELQSMIQTLTEVAK